MIACGIEMAASEARLVLLSGSKAEYTYINVKPHKLVLNDDENPDEVKAFRDAINAFFRENKVDLIAIKKRGKKGDYAGGAISFKLEGIVQLYADANIKLIAPQSIGATIKKSAPTHPKGLLKYQISAFETAFAALPKS